MKSACQLPAAAFFLAFCLNIFWPQSACARTVEIDDAGTQVVQPSVQMRWKSAAPSRSGASNLLTGTMTVRVHLNTSPWLRRSGRIYLVLPAQAPGPMQANWTTLGRLLPGSVVTGNRTLVYAGPLTSRFLDDVLTLQVSVNGGLLTRPVPVNFHFELDEE